MQPGHVLRVRIRLPPHFSHFQEHRYFNRWVQVRGRDAAWSSGSDESVILEDLTNESPFLETRLSEEDHVALSVCFSTFANYGWNDGDWTIHVFTSRLEVLRNYTTELAARRSFQALRHNVWFNRVLVSVLRVFGVHGLDPDTRSLILKLL